jgi:signal transduction histidine kinase
MISLLFFVITFILFHRFSTLDSIKKEHSKAFLARLAYQRLGFNFNSRRVYGLFVVNLLFALFATVFLIHNIIAFILGDEVFHSITLRGMILLLGSSSALLLLRKSLTASAYLTSFIPVVVLYVIPPLAIPNQSVDEAILINIMGLFVACTIPFMLFSVKRDFMTILWLNMGIFSLHSVVLFHNVFYRLPVESDLVFYFQRNYLLLFLFQCSIWQFLFWLLYSNYMKSEHDQQALKSYAQLIQEQKNEIETQNTGLKEQQDLLSTLNERLELLVTERTSKLNNQNAKLLEYAYLNSHRLRAPMSRIKGLRNLMAYDPENSQQYEVYLQQALDELDQVVESISLILQNEDPELLKEIQKRVRQNR